MHTFARSFCECLSKQVSLYSPAHVLRSIWEESPRVIQCMQNVTMFGLTVHCAFECKSLRSWYRSSTRTYVHLLDIQVDRAEMVSMYVCAGIVQMKTLAQRVTFLDLCICALRNYPTSAPIPELPMGASVHSLKELRRYLIEKSNTREL